MTPGTIAVLMLFAFITISALFQPWKGCAGYGFWAVLCPTWNWRWSLPLFAYQKYMAGATLIGFLISGMRRQKLSKAGVIAVSGLCIYLVLSFVSAQQSINPVKTALYLDVTWKIALMALLACWTIDSSQKLMLLCWALCIAQGWNAFNVNQTYYQYNIIVEYFKWNYLDNNVYSISTVPPMAISFALLIYSQKRWMTVLAGMVFVLQMHQLMVLQSRGTMLGAIALVLIGVLLMEKNRKTLTIVGMGFIAGAVLAGPPVVKEFMSSFEQEGERDSSAESRFKLWSAGAQIMSDHPLLGVGPWCGERFVPKYYEGKVGTAKALHNLFFEVGTGSGIPALTAYLLYFFAPLYGHFRLWRKRRHQFSHCMRVCNLAVLAGIPGYFVASMFSSGALVESPYLLVVIGVASLAQVYAGSSNLLVSSSDAKGAGEFAFGHPVSIAP